MIYCICSGLLTELPGIWFNARLSTVGFHAEVQSFQHLWSFDCPGISTAVHRMAPKGGKRTFVASYINGSSADGGDFDLLQIWIRVVAAELRPCDHPSNPFTMPSWSRMTKLNCSVRIPILDRCRITKHLVMLLLALPAMSASKVMTGVQNLLVKRLAS